jgi:hypothetical protein
LWPLDRRANTCRRWHVGKEKALGLRQVRVVAVRSGRGRSQALESKVRFADNPSGKLAGGCQTGIWTGSTNMGVSEPSAIRVNALLIVSVVFFAEMWRCRVAFEAVWQSLYLFSMVCFARKISSERTKFSILCGVSGPFSAGFAGEVQRLFLS